MKIAHKGYIYESIEDNSAHFRKVTLSALRDAGYSGSITNRNTVYLYHGTSVKNANSILKSGTFKGHPFFSPDKSVAELYAKRNHPRNSTVIELEVDPAAILPTGSDEYYSARLEGLTIHGWSSSNNIWHLPGSVEIMEVATKPRKPSTAEFKNWVGYSKLPVVYHATPNEFDSFDVDKSDLGAHFGTLEQAEYVLKNRLHGVGKVMPFFINLRNPLRLIDDGCFNASCIRGQLLKKGLINKQLAEEIAVGGYKEDRKYNKIVRDLLQNQGYDGIVYKNTNEGKGDSYIIFSPSQVKSADRNSGKFDRDDSNFLNEGVFERDGYIYESFEPDDLIAYHVTYARNIDDIYEHGIIGNAGGGIGVGAYQSWSNGKVFFSTCRDDVSFWLEKYENHAVDRSDDVLADGLIPLVLRFPVYDDFSVDEVGKSEGRRCSHYFEESVPSDEIEVFFGGWHPISDFTGGFDFSSAVNEDGYLNSQVFTPTDISN